MRMTQSLHSAGPEESASASAAAGELPVLLTAGAQLPERAHAGDAGLDLASTEHVVLEPGGRALVGTGLSIALPEGTVGLVCPRSGLAARHGITVLNSPGIVDAGYRGELKVMLSNTDPREAFELRPGDRIAQLVIVPFLAPRPVPVQSLDRTTRGSGGFGSSGGFASAAIPAPRDGAAATDEGKD